MNFIITCLKKNKCFYPERIRIRPANILVLIVLHFVFSCSSAQNEFYVKRPQNLPEWEEGKVALLPVLQLSNLIGARTSESQFNDNVYIGKINFSGGYVKKETSLGVITKNKNTVFNNEKEYADQSSREVSAELLKLFQKKKIDFNFLEKIDSKLFTGFLKTQDYSKSPDEGKDNINLPRYKYLAPNAIPSALEKNADIIESGARYVFVPIVVQYYSHNAGWFNDQEIGCLAGARIALQFVVYDRKSRTKVMDLVFERKKIYPLISSVNINQTYRDLNEILSEIIQNADSYIVAPK